MTKGKNGGRLLAVAQNKHPTMKYTTTKLPWEIEASEQEKIDAILNCMIIPTHYKNDYSIRYPFKQTGFLRSKHHAVFVVTYATYALSFSSVGDDYKHFAARYASDLRGLLNPCLSISYLEEQLIPSIDETRGIYLGLFPDSEQVFIVHQLICIARHIRYFGHVRGLMCFAGERANTILSDCITKGGVNYLKTMYFRYIMKENYFLSMFNQNKSEDIDNSGMYSDFALKLCGDVEKLELDAHHLNKLYTSLFEFVESQEIDDSCNKSSFFRLYKAYDHMRTLNKNDTNIGFWSWLNTAILELKVEGNSVVPRLLRN